MTDKEDDWTELDEARLARLMRSVPRGVPDPAARARAFEAVRAQWRQAQSQVASPRASRRAGSWLAAAAVAVIALAGTLWLQPFAPQIASLDRAYGRVTSAGDLLATGARIRRGTTLATAADSGALLRYSPDLTLRLDAGTRVTLADAGSLRLESGRVYVAITPGAAVSYVVHTAAGDVRHVGTRYVVSAHGTGLEVDVREGIVQVEVGARTERAVAGEALRMGAGGTVERSVLTGDAQWAWVESLPTPIAIEGKPLADFLRWFAAETGRRVAYADESTRARAAAAILHGSVDGLPPAQALAIVTASVDLEAVVPKEGPVVIGPAHR